MDLDIIKHIQANNIFKSLNLFEKNVLIQQSLKC
jgi:hypothetical protein